MPSSLSARATVLSLDNSNGMAYANVVVEAAPACPRCASGRGCGAGAFAASRKGSRVKIEVPARLHLSAGDVVNVEANSQSLLEASMLAYGIPLAGMVTGTLLAALLGLSEGLTIAVAVAGLCLGLAAGKRASRAVCWQEQLRLASPLPPETAV